MPRERENEEKERENGAKKPVREWHIIKVKQEGKWVIYRKRNDLERRSTDTKRK